MFGVLRGLVDLIGNLFRVLQNNLLIIEKGCLGGAYQNERGLRRGPYTRTLHG